MAAGLVMHRVSISSCVMPKAIMYPLIWPHGFHGIREDRIAGITRQRKMLDTPPT